MPFAACEVATNNRLWIRFALRLAILSSKGRTTLMQSQCGFTKAGAHSLRRAQAF
jgi:hypothetical protein